MKKDKLFFTADLHFGHHNILCYDSRPFLTIEEHDEVLIQNWNSVAPHDSKVFVLGDLFWSRNPDVNLGILKRLNGRIILVKGNHEKWLKKLTPQQISLKIDKVVDYLEIKVQDPEADNGRSQHIVMCHYAFLTWNRALRGSWNLFGHSHGNLPISIGKSLDVGINSHSYYPISYSQVRDIMSKRDKIALGYNISALLKAYSKGELEKATRKEDE